MCRRLGRFDVVEGVVEQGAVDDVGQPAFQASHRFHGGLPGELLVHTGPTTAAGRFESDRGSRAPSRPARSTVGPARSYGGPVTTAYWGSPEFRTALTTFVTAAVGEPRSLEPDRVRPWSTVWRAETARGVFWAKDNCRRQRHEASLLLRLGELAPDRVLPVTAAEPDVGLLLTPDRGVPLARTREVDTDTWCDVVAAHAGLQRDVAPHLPTLGLTRLAAADAVGHVERLMSTLRGYPDGDPRRLTDDQARAVEATLPDVALWSDQVAALGLPVTIDHNDLHPNNVFEVDGRLELFDFGDAVAQEPLAALRIPLASAHEDGLDLPRIADAGIEAWSDVAPAAALRAALRRPRSSSACWGGRSPGCGASPTCPRPSSWSSEAAQRHGSRGSRRTLRSTRRHVHGITRADPGGYPDARRARLGRPAPRPPLDHTMTDEDPPVAAPRPRGGARRAVKSHRVPRRHRAPEAPAPGGGRRALRERHRRARGLPSTLALTVLGAAVPGTGYLYTGRRALGGLVLLAWASLAGSPGLVLRPRRPGGDRPGLQPRAAAGGRPAARRRADRLGLRRPHLLPAGAAAEPPSLAHRGRLPRRARARGHRRRTGRAGRRVRAGHRRHHRHRLRRGRRERHHARTAPRPRTRGPARTGSTCCCSAATPAWAAPASAPTR